MSTQEGNSTSQPAPERETERFRSIPAELRDLPHWVNWRHEKRGGKPTKVPYCPTTGRRADTKNPTTWTSSQEALAAYANGGYDGIGYVFSKDDPYCGIDLDRCISPETGETDPGAKELVRKLNSYTERTPSGKGLHIIVKGKLPAGRRRKDNIEMYDDGRYFTFTGDHIPGTPATVEDRLAVLSEIHAEIFGSKSAAPSRNSDNPPPVRAPLALSDQELINKASTAKNGADFSALWRGDWKGAGYTSQSDADAALLSMLRFWTGGDKARAFALFERSGLSREKWTKREDYRQRTWAKVSDGEVYSPPSPTALSTRSAARMTEGGQEAPQPAEEPFTPFPVDALPEPNRTLIIRGAQAIGCDPALVALPHLAAAAASIGNSRRIRLKHGWCEPSILWCVSVADSGSAKSPALDLALDGLVSIEAKLLAENRASEAAFKAEKLQWKKSGSSGQEPTPPVHKRQIVRDATVEALACKLAENPRGLLLARDELAALLGGFDKYSRGRGEEVSHYLEMHRGGPVTTDRKTGDNKHVHCPRASLSITGTIQPGTLERTLERRHFENGLAARLLLARPPRPLRKWNEDEVDRTILLPVRLVFERLVSLLMGADENGNPEPIDIPMAPEAKLRWIEFYDAHNIEQSTLGDERLSAAWSKLEGAAARFSLVIHCIRCAAQDAGLDNPLEVDRASVEAGIQLVTWFKGETRRIYTRMFESAIVRDARKAVEFLRARSGRSTLRDMEKAGLLGGDGSRIIEILTRLEATGAGKWDDVPTGSHGGRPTRVFTLAGGTPKTDEAPLAAASLPNPETPKPAKPPTVCIVDEVSPVTPVLGVKEVSPVETSEGFAVVMEEMDL
jgi:hypothetical protein